MDKIYIIHENDDWMPPFREVFQSEGLPFEEWHMARVSLDLEDTPPEGVFYSRMSASAHTRGHRSIPEYTAGVLCWLEHHGRRVVNGSRALDLELSKLRQYQALKASAIRVPHTRVARNVEELRALSLSVPEPFITKHNRGGKGLGVQLFQDAAALSGCLNEGRLEAPVDGIFLLQEYIRSEVPFITRCEFIGGEFVYAVRVNTADGFELCPADACQIDDTYCPAGSGEPNRFEIVGDFDDLLLLKQYGSFLRDNDIEVAGIEFITDLHGRQWTYDVNTNTNYNPAAEVSAGASAPRELARFLGMLIRLSTAYHWRASEERQQVLA